MRWLRSFQAAREGSAAAEMALVAPMLITLMFGSFELGNYFMSEHAVAKAVRDGARFASRLPASLYVCPAGGADGSAGSFAISAAATLAQSQIKNVTRTGSIDGSATPRLSYWTTTQETTALPNGSPITLTVTCRLATTYTGIFSGIEGNVPVVTVAANVHYPSLLGQLGLAGTNLRLNSQSQVPVMGI